MSLRNSARNGNVNAVRKLLNNGVNINEADQYGETPLHSIGLLLFGYSKKI